MEELVLETIVSQEWMENIMLMKKSPVKKVKNIEISTQKVC